MRWVCHWRSVSDRTPSYSQCVAATTLVCALGPPMTISEFAFGRGLLSPALRMSLLATCGADAMPPGHVQRSDNLVSSFGIQRPNTYQGRVKKKNQSGRVTRRVRMLRLCSGGGVHVTTACRASALRPHIVTSSRCPALRHRGSACPRASPRGAARAVPAHPPAGSRRRPCAHSRLCSRPCR